MVTIEVLNCPQCGAPVDIVREDWITICVHCESRLLIKFDQGNQQSAAIDRGEITADKRTALISSLRGQLVRLRDEKNTHSQELYALINQLNRAKNTAVAAQGTGMSGPIGLIAIIVVIFILMIIAMSNDQVMLGACIFFTLPVAIGFYVLQSTAKEKDRKAQTAAQHDQAAEKERRQLEEQVNELAYRAELTERQIKKLKAGAAGNAAPVQAQPERRYTIILNSAGPKGPNVLEVVNALMEILSISREEAWEFVKAVPKTLADDQHEAQAKAIQTRLSSLGAEVILAAR